MRQIIVILIGTSYIVALIRLIHSLPVGKGDSTSSADINEINPQIIDESGLPQIQPSDKINVISKISDKDTNDSPKLPESKIKSLPSLNLSSNKSLLFHNSTTTAVYSASNISEIKSLEFQNVTVIENCSSGDKNNCIPSVSSEKAPEKLDSLSNYANEVNKSNEVIDSIESIKNRNFESEIKSLEKVKIEENPVPNNDNISTESNTPEGIVKNASIITEQKFTEVSTITNYNTDSSNQDDKKETSDTIHVVSVEATKLDDGLSSSDKKDEINTNVDVKPQLSNSLINEQDEMQKQSALEKSTSNDVIANEQQSINSKINEQEKAGQNLLEEKISNTEAIATNLQLSNNEVSKTENTFEHNVKETHLNYEEKPSNSEVQPPKDKLNELEKVEEQIVKGTQSSNEKDALEKPTDNGVNVPILSSSATQSIINEVPVPILSDVPNSSFDVANADTSNSYDNTDDYSDDDDDDVSNYKFIQEEPIKNPIESPEIMETETFSDDQDSHFFAYFLTIMVTSIICYLVFHNKKRIFALIIEGRAPKNGRSERRQANKTKYHKLDNNLEEAMSTTKGTKDPASQELD